MTVGELRFDRVTELIIDMPRGGIVRVGIDRPSVIDLLAELHAHGATSSVHLQLKMSDALAEELRDKLSAALKPRVNQHEPADCCSDCGRLFPLPVAHLEEEDHEVTSIECRCDDTFVIYQAPIARCQEPSHRA